MTAHYWRWLALKRHCSCVHLMYCSYFTLTALWRNKCTVFRISGPLSKLAQNRHQCVVVNIFFQSSSSCGRLSGEIYLAAFSTGLVWHRCFKADFSLCASPQAFLILMGWVSGDISGLWLWQSCGESVVCVCVGVCVLTEECDGRTEC